MVYIIPLIKHIVGSSLEAAFSEGFTTADVYLLFGMEAYNLIVDSSDLCEAYEKGKIISMVWETAKLLWRSPTFKRMIAVQIGRSVAAGLFEKAVPILKVVGIVVEGVNAGVATAQMAMAKAQVTFEAIEAEPGVHITEPSDNLSTKERVIHVRGEVENIESQQGLMTVNGREQIIPIENGKFDAVAILTSGENLIKVTVDGVSREIRVTNTAPPTTLFVMLTWKENQSDVDLYVTEPDGQTAWFGIYGQRQEPPFRTTNGGELDVDNVEGFGPERYFISSADGDKILPGPYVINVHYYESHGYLGPIHYTVLILRNEQFYDMIEGSIPRANKLTASPKDAGKDDTWAHIADIELITGPVTEPGEPITEPGLTPDLIIRRITIDGEATIGEPIHYTVTIENVDAGTAVNVIVKTYSGSAPDDLSNAIDQYIVPKIRPGGTHIRTLEFIPDSFYQYIVAKVDGDDRITETQEDNNLGASRLQFHYEVEMVLIPAGEFSMGDHHNAGDSDEKPVHTVYLDAFYIDVYEVTNAQYARFLNEYGKNTDAAGHELLDIGDSDCLIEKVGNTYKPKAGYEDHPVIEVSWYGAAAYAKFHGKRLPTEAEWEKAARGGLVGKKYPWGDNISHDDANYSGTGGRDRWNGTSPVGSFAPNGYGLYDMAGNVWEWCADWYDSGYYARSAEENPKGPSSGTYRVLRGGSWYYDTNGLRCAYRYGLNAGATSRYGGFRCAQDQ